MIKRAIDQELEKSIQNFSVEASSSFVLDNEPEYAELLNWTLSEYFSINVIESDEDTITVSFYIEASADFYANFYFSTYDSVDREHVSFGQNHIGHREDFDVRVVILLRKVDYDHAQPIEVEVQGHPLRVDFGEVFPEDWTD